MPGTLFGEEYISFGQPGYAAQQERFRSASTAEAVREATDRFSAAQATSEARLNANLAAINGASTPDQFGAILNRLGSGDGASVSPGAMSSSGGAAAAGGAAAIVPGGAVGTYNASGSYNLEDVETTAPSRTQAAQMSDDRRVRLKAIVGQEENVYGPNEPENLLSILHSTGGMLFPYTPSISMNQDVDYRSSDLTHTNMDIMSYSRTPSVTLSVTGRFSVQNQREGRYALAVLHFLRVVSKMHFGEIDAQEGKAGLPPPILCFDGYGNYMFNNLQCVLKAHNYTFDDTVDYVDIKGVNTITRVPSLFTLAITLTVTRSPQSQRSEFNMTDFRSGRLMRGGNKGWI